MMDNTNTTNYLTSSVWFNYDFPLVDQNHQDFADSESCDNTFPGLPHCSLFDIGDYTSEQMDEELTEVFAATFNMA